MFVRRFRTGLVARLITIVGLAGVVGWIAVVPAHASAWTDTLYPNEQLLQQDQLIAHNGLFKLWMQADSNLVLHGPDLRPLRATNTGPNERVVYNAIIQADGNFVLYTPSHVPVWASNTGGHPQSRLVMQDDGNLVIYDYFNRLSGPRTPSSNDCTP